MFNRVKWQRYDGEIPKSCVRITRTLAERLEDNGSAAFWMCHTCDCFDARYLLGVDSGHIHTFALENGNIFFFVEKEDQDEVVYTYWFDEMNAKRLLVQLCIEYGVEIGLLDMLKRALGDVDIISRLLSFCNKNQVECKSLVYSQSEGEECDLIW